MIAVKFSKVPVYRGRNFSVAESTQKKKYGDCELRASQFWINLAGINRMLVILLDDMIPKLVVDIWTVEFCVDMC